MRIWDNYPTIETKVLAASIRHPMHMLQAMQMGAHTATMPTKIFRQLMKHPLTDSGIAQFLADWEEVEAAGNA
jgi:transaldolase